MNFKLLNLGIFAISIIVFILFCEKYIHYTIDDAFIFYRYSDNIANGFLFSWNYDGEKEFGFTSYLYTIVVALGIKLGLDPIIFSKAVTVFSGISIMFLVSSTDNVVWLSQARGFLGGLTILASLTV